jgi:hypothetical protein
MSNPIDEDSNEAGYGKPPRKRQYCKGQSGNLKGRPKKKAGDQSLESVLKQRVRIQINGKERLVSLNEALLRMTAKRATSGDIPATQEFLKLAESLRVRKVAREPERHLRPVQTIFDPEDCEAILESLGIVRIINGNAKIEAWVIEAALVQNPNLHFEGSELSFVSWASVDGTCARELLNRRVN